MHLPVAHYEGDFLEFESIFSEHAIGKKKFFANETIAGRKDCFKNCYYIQKGIVKMIAVAGHDEEICINHYGSGMIAPIIFGTDLSFSLEPYISYIADTDIEVLELEPQVLTNLATQIPSLSLKVIRHLSQISNLLLTRNILCKYTSYERICGYLALYMKNNSDTTLRMSQEALASIAGLTRVQVNKILNQLSQEHIVALGNKRIEIIDKERLINIAPGFFNLNNIF